MKDANKRGTSTNWRRIGNPRPSGFVVEDGLYYITELALVGWVRFIEGSGDS